MELQNDQNLEDITTKPSLMKRMYFVGCNIMWCTFIYWLVYTIIFLFVDGWHMEAISPVEKTLDTIASVGWNIGLLLVIFPMINKLSDIIDREN